MRTLALCVLLATPAAANSRLKAIADFESVRGHFLARYGVVVELDGTGDSLRNSAFAEERLGTMRRRLGVGMCGLDLETKKVAPTIVPAAGALEAPSSYRGQITALLTEIEQLQMRPDQPERIVIDARSGIVVRGAAVRIGQVAVAQGNLTVRVVATPQVPQPRPLAEGDTVAVPRTRVEVEGKDLVTGLNALGVGARDLIDILQVIKGSRRAAGGNRGDVMGEMSVNPGVAPSATSPSGGSPRSDGAAALPHAAQEFEVVFLDQGLGTMTQDMDGDNLVGSGQSGVFRDMSAEEIAKPISWTVGIGSADAALRKILKARELA